MLWMQQDAPQLIRDKLRKVLEVGSDVVRASVPNKWSPLNGQFPMITVDSDGPQRSERGTDRELVRVTCRMPDLVQSRKLMGEIDAFLTTPGFHFLGVSISRSQGTGLITGPDSLLGGYFASATYSVGTTRKVKTNGFEA